MYQYPRIVVTARWLPLPADGFNEVADILLITFTILMRNDLNRSLIKNDASLIKPIAAWPLDGSNHTSSISNTLTKQSSHSQPTSTRFYHEHPASALEQEWREA